MDLDELIKYITWVLFFSIAAAGIIFGLKKIGVV